MKALLSFLIAGVMAAIIVNNLSDSTGLRYTAELMKMSTVPDDTPLKRRRAIFDPRLHRMAYGVIVAMEAITAALCAVGGWLLLQGDRRGVMITRVGLGMGLALFVGIFRGVGQWFLSWRGQFNGLADTSQLALVMLGMLGVIK
ncbi:MAG: DUF2165 family protein [Anaerolineae bacterium]